MYLATERAKARASSAYIIKSEQSLQEKTTLRP
jgi:hypothetical protein